MNQSHFSALKGRITYVHWWTHTLTIKRWTEWVCNGCVCASRYAHQMSSPRASIMSTHRVWNFLSISSFLFPCAVWHILRDILQIISEYLFNIINSQAFWACVVCLLSDLKLLFFYFTTLRAQFYKWECNLWKSIAQFAKLLRRQKKNARELRLGVLLYVCISVF